MKNLNEIRIISEIQTIDDILKSDKKRKKEKLDSSLHHLLRTDTFTKKTKRDDFDIVVKKIAKKAEEGLENINPNLLDFSNEEDVLLFKSDDFKDDPLTNEMLDSEYENLLSL